MLRSEAFGDYSMQDQGITRDILDPGNMDRNSSNLQPPTDQLKPQNQVQPLATSRTSGAPKPGPTFSHCKKWCNPKTNSNLQPSPENLEPQTQVQPSANSEPVGPQHQGQHSATSRTFGGPKLGSTFSQQPNLWTPKTRSNLQPLQEAVEPQNDLQQPLPEQRSPKTYYNL